MLIHPTVERLRALGLSAMADAFIELQSTPAAAELSRQDWLGLLVDREATSRENKRLARRLREAKLRQAAVVEDVNLHAPRGLDRALFQKLATCEWLRDHHHLVVIGPTGIGKSWLACALGHKACREGFSVLYKRGQPAIRRPCPGSRRGPTAAPPGYPRTRPALDHRRLGTGAAQCRAAPRSAGDRR